MKTICFSVTVEVPEDLDLTEALKGSYLSEIEDLLAKRGLSDLYDSETIEEDL